MQTRNSVVRQVRLPKVHRFVMRTSSLHSSLPSRSALAENASNNKSPMIAAGPTPLNDPSKKTPKKQPDQVVVRACIQTLRQGLEQMSAMKERIDDLIKRMDEADLKKRRR